MKRTQDVKIRGSESERRAGCVGGKELERRQRIGGSGGSQLKRKREPKGYRTIVYHLRGKREKRTSRKREKEKKRTRRTKRTRTHSKRACCARSRSTTTTLPSDIFV